MIFKRFASEEELDLFSPTPGGHRRFRDEDDARTFVTELELDSSDPFGLRRALPAGEVDAGTDVCSLSETDVRNIAARALVTGSLVARAPAPEPGGGGGGRGQRPNLPQQHPTPQPPAPARAPKPRVQFSVTLSYVAFLAPGAEDPSDLAIRWNISDPDARITRGTLALHRSHESPGVPVWTKVLESAERAAGDHELQWDGATGERVDFPDGCVSVEFSPYTLVITVTDGAEHETASAEFRVEAVRITLDFGTEDMLNEEANKLLLADLHRAGAPIDVPLIELGIRSNVFKENDHTDIDPSGLAGFAAYRRRHGFGPHIPIVASVYCRNSRSNEVLAPRAWGRRTVLWSLEYTDMNEWLTGAAAEFVRQTAHYYSTDSLPEGTACHEDRGGKRSATGDRHFSAVASAPLPTTPPRVHTCGLFTGTTQRGPLAGRTATLFSPPAQAGDGHVVVARFDARRDLDVRAPRADLWARTGTFHLTRRVTLAKLLKKHPRGDCLPVEQIPGLAPLRAAAVVIDVEDPTYADIGEDRYRAAVAQALAATSLPLAPYIVDLGPEAWNSGSFLRLETFEAFQGKMRADPRHAQNPVLKPFVVRNEDTAAERKKKEDDYYARSRTDARALMRRILPAFAADREGITLVCFDGFSNLDWRYEHAALGGASAATGDPRRGVVALFVPTLRNLAHELGHSLFLVHAPGRDARDAPDARPQAHDSTDLMCLMNSDAASSAFCGLCVLRLRGWDTHQVTNQATENGR